DQVVMECYLKPVSIPGVTHCMEAFRHPFSIAVLTPGTHLAAPCDRIPRRLGPFNRRLPCHNRFLPEIPSTPRMRTHIRQVGWDSLRGLWNYVLSTYR